MYRKLVLFQSFRKTDNDYWVKLQKNEYKNNNSSIIETKFVEGDIPRFLILNEYFKFLNSFN